MDTVQKPKHPTIALTPCTSSRICAHGWDPETQTLALQFYKKVDGEQVPGTVYHYAGVTKAVYGDLQKAESLGKFFADVIQVKDDNGALVYPFTKIEQETEAEEAR